MPRKPADLAVQVFATFPDKSTGLGTAYPVTPDRLLTAYHVICKNGVMAETIEVRWFVGHDDLATDWVPATPVRHSAEELDIAILSSEFPERAKGPFPKCVGLDPKPSETWESWGYPVVGVNKDGYRRLIPIQGKWHGAQSWEKDIDLGVDYTIDIPSGWSGMSGSPVFVNGNIVGIITQRPKGFEQNRLIAVSIKAAMKCPDFKSLIGIPDLNLSMYRENWDKERSSLINFITSNKHIIRYFTGFDIHRPEIIFDNSMVDFMVSIENFCQNLEDARVVDLNKYIPDLCDHAFAVVNSLVREEFIGEILRQRNGSGSAVMCNIALTPMAEIAMSAIDRRRPLFKEIRETGDHIGGYVVPKPPPIGLHANIESVAEQIRDDLAKELGIDFTSSHERKLVLNSQALSVAAKRRKSRYIILDGNDKGQREKSARLAENLNESYPSLAIFCRGDHEHASDEVSLPDVVASIYEFRRKYSQ